MHSLQTPSVSGSTMVNDNSMNCQSRDVTEPQREVAFSKSKMQEGVLAKKTEGPLPLIYNFEQAFGLGRKAEDEIFFALRERGRAVITRG